MDCVPAILHPSQVGRDLIGISVRGKDRETSAVIDGAVHREDKYAQILTQNSRASLQLYLADFSAQLSRNIVFN